MKVLFLVHNLGKTRHFEGVIHELTERGPAVVIPAAHKRNKPLKLAGFADNPRVGTLPDFGNFHLGGGKYYDFYQGVEELMPYAKAVSAKSYGFDAEGNETNTDYRRMMNIVLAAGYRGYVGIEYEGSKLGEAEGILATKKLLEPVRAELS